MREKNNRASSVTVQSRVLARTLAKHRVLCDIAVGLICARRSKEAATGEHKWPPFKATCAPHFRVLKASAVSSIEPF